MKKTSIYCNLGFHQYRWNWRNLCHTCMHCGKTKNDLLHKIKNIIIFLSALACFILVVLALYNARANQMQKYEQAHNCRYDYNDLCYTEQEKPWLFND